MTTGNRAVTAALQRRLRPVLREAGFEDFTGRKAWRVQEEVISLVACIGLVGAYTAGAIGCTSFSFGVEVGVFFRVFDRDLCDRRTTTRPSVPSWGRPFVRRS